MFSLYIVVKGVTCTFPLCWVPFNFCGGLQSYRSQKITGKNHQLIDFLPLLLAESLPVFLLTSVSLFVLVMLKGDETA